MGTINMQNEYQGVLPDNRVDSQKQKDFKLNEMELSSAPKPDWKEKGVDEWKNYPSRNQITSSSCVAQAYAKALFTLGYDIVSAHPTYRLRKNFNEKGMWLYDGADILLKTGTVPETVAKSQNLGEYEMNRDLEKETRDYLSKSPYKIGGYAYVNKNIEDIASAIEEHKHCVLTFGASNSEWTDIPQVSGNVAWYHAVCAVDYVIYNGKKYIVIEDSWGDTVGRFGDRRLISEEFIKERCTGAIVVLSYVAPDKKPFVFTKILRLGSTGNEVEMLQKALKTLGYFPNIQTTQYFGKVTELAVKKFQEAYKDEILKPSGLSKPTGIFGQSTMKKLNQLMNDKWYQSSSGTGSVSMTIKGSAVAIIPIVIYLASLNGYNLTETEVGDLINAGATAISAIMIFIGIVRKIYLKLYPNTEM